MNQVLHSIAQNYMNTLRKIQEDAKPVKGDDPNEALRTIERRSKRAIEFHEQKWKSIDFEDYRVVKELTTLREFPDAGTPAVKNNKKTKNLEDF